MIVQSLELSNYRNYEKADISFSEDINIFYGDNAQGKTNILEAIYMAATSKSHRGSKDRDVIRFEEEESHIKMMVKRRESVYRIDMHLKKNRNKGIAVNGVPIRRASELFGILNVVFFSPEDLQIIKNGPSERRRFIDSELCQLDKIYLNSLVSYNKVLQQRNQLLKNMFDYREYEDMLSVYDEQLVMYAGNIIRIREAFVKELNELIRKIHSRLTAERESIEIQYEKNVSKDSFGKELLSCRERDFRTKSTNKGPHRDDISFIVSSEDRKSIDLRVFGSQGQQRTGALSLKMAEIELVKKRTGEAPVLLLDDVLSELDSNRQVQLLNSIQNIQTFITCTGLDDFISNRFHMDRIFYVENGNIFTKNVD